MLIVAKRRYKKHYVIGGAGIFDVVSGFFKKLFTSNAAKQIASTALSAGKDAAKEIGKNALDVGKTAAIDAGKRLVDKAVAKIMSPKNLPTTSPAATQALSALSPFQHPQMQSSIPLTQESKNVLNSLINDRALSKSTNINNLMMGHGMNSNAKSAIRIQDLVRRLNGAGLKVA
jgi:hypothetical protein